MAPRPEPNPEPPPPPPTDPVQQPAPGMIPDGIDAEQCQVILRQARRRRRKIDRAVTLASFNGWTLAVLAGLCLPFAPFNVITAVAVAVMGTAAFVEFHGRSLMRRLDERAPRILAANQAALGVIAITYAAWRLWLIRSGQDQNLVLVRQLGPSSGIVEMAQSIEELVYATVIGGVVLLQGAAVWFYLSRRRLLRRYREQTPQWVIALMQAAS